MLSKLGGTKRIMEGVARGAETPISPDLCAAGLRNQVAHRDRFGSFGNAMRYKYEAENCTQSCSRAYYLKGFWGRVMLLRTIPSGRETGDVERVGTESREKSARLGSVSREDCESASGSGRRTPGVTVVERPHPREGDDLCVGSRWPLDRAPARRVLPKGEMRTIVEVVGDVLGQ